MAFEPVHFEDPALKATVRHAWAKERAPAALRRQVAAIALDARPVTRSLRLPFRPFAAAAVLVLGISSLVYQVTQIRPYTPTLPHHFTMEMSLVKDLAGRHDASAAAGDNHMPGIPKDDFGKISGELRERLHFAVLAASPGADFQFKGASVIEVDGHIPAAQLLFKHNGDFISVFSLPAEVVPQTKQGARYDGYDDKHMMTGFVYDGSFYCIAASSPTHYSPTACNGLLSSVLQEVTSQLPATAYATPATKQTP